jgi:vancomycin resistance protein YoaR
MALDAKRLPDLAIEALRFGDGTVELPLLQAPKRIPDQALDRITEVVSSFTTKFNRGQVNRSSNIALAASIINGTVLMPGQTFSYNKTVGQRLVSRGFKLAGVYRNGRHDQGIGGGICQVSTTLYNAALIANLPIVQRNNHSMPVPYVPLGRDATVDYGSLDMQFKNSYPNPIAISAHVNGGAINFTILGVKQPGLQISLETSNHSSWSNTVKYVTDSSVPAGKTKIVEKGSIGRRCLTWRVVRINGKVVKRENLGVSLYRPSARIIARGPAPKPTATETPAEPPPSEPPPAGY